MATPDVNEADENVNFAADEKPSDKESSTDVFETTRFTRLARRVTSGSQDPAISGAGDNEKLSSSQSQLLSYDLPPWYGSNTNTGIITLTLRMQVLEGPFPSDRRPSI